MNRDRAALAVRLTKTTSCYCLQNNQSPQHFPADMVQTNADTAVDPIAFPTTVRIIHICISQTFCVALGFHKDSTCNIYESTCTLDSPSI